MLYRDRINLYSPYNRKENKRKKMSSQQFLISSFNVKFHPEPNIRIGKALKSENDKVFHGIDLIDEAFINN